MIQTEGWGQGVREFFLLCDLLQARYTLPQLHLGHRVGMPEYRGVSLWLGYLLEDPPSPSPIPWFVLSDPCPLHLRHSCPLFLHSTTSELTAFSFSIFDTDFAF